MNKMLERVISYDFTDHTWRLHSTSSTSQKRTVYWGSSSKGLPILIGGHSHLPSRRLQMKVLLETTGSKTIIGPLIGILTAKGNSYPFAGVKANFIDIIKTGRRLGAIVFVFTPEGINWGTERIEGYVYHLNTNSWRRVTFPFPNVVYNRIPKRGYETMTSTSTALERLKKIEGLSLFNPHFFNKGELFHKLKNSAVDNYLPATKFLRKKEELHDMLQQHTQLYLKPTSGKAGSGIMRIHKDFKQKKYILQVPQSHSTRSISCSNITILWRNINKYMIASPYIIQRGISLAQYNQSPFDFRTLVQRGRDGKWQIAGLGIRVAGKNRITTHVPRGGRIESPHIVLNKVFSAQKAKSIQDNVKKMALAIAKEIEKHYSLLGEMSMDIGLDTEGNLWFFEANAKPMKFDEPEIRKRSLENIIYFSQYLTFHDSLRGEKEHAIAKYNR